MCNGLLIRSFNTSNHVQVIAFFLGLPSRSHKTSLFIKNVTTQHTITLHHNHNIGEYNTRNNSITMNTPPRTHRKTKLPYPVSTPPRTNSRKGMAPHLSSSPSLLRTPIRGSSNRKTINHSPSSSSDRFIPNRANMNMDLCRASVLSSEKRRMESISKAAANQRRRLGENGHPNAHSPTRTPQGDQDSALQTEFRRRMKGALFDIPVSDLVQTETVDAKKKQTQNRQNSGDLSNLAYATLPELEAEAEDSPMSETPTGGTPSRSMYQEVESRLLSFHSEPRTLDAVTSRDAAITMAASTDPYSHDHLRVLQRSASKENYGRYMGGDDADFQGAGLQSVAQKVGRRIPTAPTRILDAPDIVDDYYLNLISWGEDNILAVALGQCVYLWDATTGDIEHLVTLRGADDYVTSVSWATIPGHSKYIAVGTNSGNVQLWDGQALKKVRTLSGHSNRVSSLAWNNQWLSSGGRDSLILQHDVRSANHVVSTYKGHTQEVCGLKWNDDGTSLASGGNENYLCIWDAAMSGRSSNVRGRTIQSEVTPRFLLTQHKAAVKALAWCPFRRGLLASGGGTADRTIKFWNTSNGTMLNSIDTGSQVCSLLWSKHQHELVSSHGFSENQLILWKYPTMTKIQEFKGHTSRVLHMEQSPDGGCVVSAAADETLRFWDLFGPPPSRRQNKGLGLGNLSVGLTTIR